MHIQLFSVSWYLFKLKLNSVNEYSPNTKASLVIFIRNTRKIKYI
jgi:hypothetical protein